MHADSMLPWAAGAGFPLQERDAVDVQEGGCGGESW